MSERPSWLVEPWKVRELTSFIQRLESAAPAGRPRPMTPLPESEYGVPGVPFPPEVAAQMGDDREDLDREILRMRLMDCTEILPAPVRVSA